MYRTTIKATSMELKNGNTWRKISDFWSAEFLTLYSNGTLAFFNEPYGTCNAIINTRSNILDIHQGASIPVPGHRLPMLPDWATREHLVLIRGHKENYYFVFKSVVEAKSWVSAINNTRALIPGMYDMHPPQPGFYPFGDYVPPGYPNLHRRLPDNHNNYMFPQPPKPNVPKNEKGIHMSPRQPLTRRRPVAVEKVEDQRPFGWTDPVEKPIFHLPEEPGHGWSKNQRSNYFFHGGETYD
ncbi:uncharacterized protein LOC142338414 isoform X2 [Convolutriloba macropyga]|uniref:uncharacterized protein LOC142338414 isoform X2 n=1 Tax=Convolutriloba macropyga TaxID=536237 RepID=UPI003F523C72